MSKYSKFGRVAKCGSTDSKYMSKANTLDNDIKAHMSESDAFKSLVKHLVIREPGKIDIRYKDLIDIAIEIKREFNL